jgi:hypothetical protein
MRQLIQDHTHRIHVRLGRASHRAVQKNLRRHPSNIVVSKRLSGSCAVGYCVTGARETKVAKLV